MSAFGFLVTYMNAWVSSKTYARSHLSSLAGNLLKHRIGRSKNKTRHNILYVYIAQSSKYRSCLICWQLAARNEFTQGHARIYSSCVLMHEDMSVLSSILAKQLEKSMGASVYNPFVIFLCYYKFP